MSFKDKILNNQSPWGSTPGGGGQNGNGSGTRREPPNLDDVIKNFQKTINKFSGGKSGGSKPIIIGLDPPDFPPENLLIVFWKFLIISSMLGGSCLLPEPLPPEKPFPPSSPGGDPQGD